MRLMNKADRLDFLRSYKAWGLWLSVPELGLRAWRYPLPSGDYLIAISYLDIRKRAGRRIREWTFPEYHLTDGEVYKRKQLSVSYLVEYLRQFRDYDFDYPLDQEEEGWWPDE